MKWTLAIIGLALTVPAHASEMLSNGDFNIFESSTSLSSTAIPGDSAAANWSLWNNTDAVTTSSVLADFQGRNDVLHITTTDTFNGAVQVFAGGAHFGYADIWVQSGRALYLAAIDGNGIQLSTTSTTGAWERLFLNTGSDAFNEVTLYSYGGAAEFYVAAASADDREASPRAVESAVPEPATWAMLMLGFGGLGHTLRRRPAAGTRIRFA